MIRFRSILIATASAGILATAALAQGPGGFQMTPAAQAKMKAWQKWNDTHKNVGAIQQTLRAIDEIQRDPKTRFNKTQARTILGILKTWRNKPVMTDAQAKKVNKQITGVFSIPQLKKMASMPKRGGRGFGGGGRPGGQGGPGGPGARPGGQGGRPGGGRGFDPASMPAPRDWNPLNPNTQPIERMRARSAQRLDDVIKALSAAK